MNLYVTEEHLRNEIKNLVSEIKLLERTVENELKTIMNHFTMLQSIIQAQDTVIKELAREIKSCKKD